MDMSSSFPDRLRGMAALLPGATSTYTLLGELRGARSGSGWQVHQVPVLGHAVLVVVGADGWVLDAVVEVWVAVACGRSDHDSGELDDVLVGFWHRIRPRGLGDVLVEGSVV